MIGSTWLPSWLGWVLSTAYVAVIAVHVHHLHGATAQGRFWHGGHLLMALGMIVMFAPTRSVVVSASVGTAVFAVAAVAMGVFALSEVLRGGARGAIVIIATVDLAAMAFMFSPASMRLTWLGLVAAAWFVVQTLGWLTGHLSALVALSPVGRELAGHPVAPTDADAAAAQSADPRGGGLLRRTIPAPVWRTSGYDLGIRITLGAMALGMAYMFLAMVFDPGSLGAMAGIDGHDGMSGM